MDVWMKFIPMALLAAGIAYYNRWNTFSAHRVILVDTISDEYDYIVVGGGSAGSIVAARLSEDGDQHVLLLEAGGFYDESINFHVPISFLFNLHTEYDWEYYTEPQRFSNLGMNDQKSYWPRGRVLGGTSVLNGMQYTRGSPFEYDQWESEGCKGWSYNDVLPYFLKSEDIRIDDLKSSRYHNTGGPLTISGGKVTPLTDIFLKAGKEMGYVITDYNGADQEGFSEIQFNIKNGIRASTGVSFLGSNAKRNNLDISINSFVTKLDIKNKRAVGAYFIRNNNKKYVRVRKEIIVSGGAINSPQLLMLSGIGPKDHLKSLNIPLVQDLPVGHNLQDHQGILLISTINSSQSMTADFITSWYSELKYKLLGTGPKSISGIDGSAFIHINKEDKGKTSPDIQLVLFSFAFSSNIFNMNETYAKELLIKDANTPGFTICLSVTHPKSKGTLLLRSDDPFDHPILNPNYLSEKEDVDNFIAGVRIWERLLETNAIRELGATIDQMKMPFCSKYKFRSDDYWECVIRHTAITAYHHSGTCKMGPNQDSSAVVDPQLRVRGIIGLRVVDASILPNITSGNISAPVMMVAEKAADMILGKECK